MNINLKRIEFENFKGLKKETIEFSKDTQIYGENAIGKTTIMDGFIWCLFGKDSQNSADFELKTLDKKGNVKHNLNHSVLCVMDVEGTERLFKRVFVEDWKKKRGDLSPTFRGHTTTYFIDEVPEKKKEYDKAISEIIDEKLFRLLTDARYFNEQLKWTDRRAILTELTGKVDETQIEGYELVKELLKDKTVDDQKKILSAKKKKINDELKEIPARIDEVSKQIIEVQQVGGDVDVLKNQKTELEEKINDLKSDDGSQEKRKQINDIDNKINEVKNTFSKNNQSQLDALLSERSPLNIELSKINGDIEEMNTYETKIKGILANKKVEIQNVRNEWSSVDEQKTKVSEECPTCLQSLPEASIQSAIENLNVKKAEKMEKLETEGHGLKEIIAGIEKQLLEIPGKLETKNAERIEITGKIQEIDVRYEDINKTVCDVSELDKQKEQIKSEMAVKVAPDDSEYRNKIIEINTNIDSINKMNLDIEKNKDYHSRITELSAKEKKLSQDYADLEKSLFAIEKFIVSKVESLESKINGMFEMSTFKMFDQQINGGINEVCETMKNGVPYRSVNNAGKIQLGVDIVNTLQKFHKTSAPVFIDNRESVTELPKIESQLISLYVSPSDSVLRVENN